MAILNVLEWNGPPSVLAWRHPSDSILLGSQLIVKEHQQAVLMKEGRMLGPFLPGRHTLDTKNIPVLKAFIATVTGGHTPFPAQVWFVNRTIDLGVKWGTATAIQIKDPTYNVMIPVLGYGVLGITVHEARKFLQKIVGALESYDRKAVEDHFRGILLTSIKSHIARSMVQRRLSILDIAAHMDVLSEDLERLFADEFGEYGLKVIDFRIESITTREDDPAVVRLRDALARKAEFQILGTDFAQSESFEVMKRAADNEGGGVGPFVGAGMGLGVGAVVGAQAAGLGAVVQPTARACPSCSTPVSPGARFCPGCGTPAGGASAPRTACRHCSSQVPAGASFCPSCGTPASSVCKKCGAEAKGSAAFCANCGTKFES